MDLPTYRTIVEDKSFFKDLERLWDKYGLRLMEEEKRCLEWNLARDPLKYDRIPGRPNYYVLRTTEIHSELVPVPTFRVIFRYAERKDPNNIFLVNIEEVPTSEEED